MSDITKKIFSIEEADAVASDDPAKPAPPKSTPVKSSLDLRPIDEEPRLKFEGRAKSEMPAEETTDHLRVSDLPKRDSIVRTRPDTDPIVSWSGGPVTRTEIETRVEPINHTLTIAGFCLGILTALAIAAWTYGYFELGQAGQTLTPFGYAALICAAIVPAVTVVLLFLCLRGLKQSRAEGQRLALIADRLMRADEAVEDDVKRLSSAIRSELSSVDARLSQSRAGLDSFGEQLARQAAQIDQQTLTVAERSETIGQAMTIHRQALDTLSDTTSTQISALAETIAARRTELEDTTQKAGAMIEAAQARLGTIAEAVETQADHLRTQTESAANALHSSADALQTVTEQSGQKAEQLRTVYDRHSDHIAKLSAALAEDEGRLDEALSKQIDRLNVIENQIEQTDTRLSALLDHAQSIQDALASRLVDIQTTLEKADTQGQAFTRDMTDRVSDAIAETRRDMALMESELRALQSRLSATTPLALDLDITEPQAQDVSKRSGRLHLKPLETDFPPLEPPGASPGSDAPIKTSAPAPIEAPDPIPVRRGQTRAQSEDNDDETLDLMAFGEQDLVQPGSDVIRRPGHIEAQRTPKAKTVEKDKPKSGWHWRDMLGRIDPLDRNDGSKSRTGTASDSLSAAQTIPPLPELPEGSDIVARLCEVQLAPSAVVDEGTIIDTTQALLTGHERVTDVVLRRLDGPVAHLRDALGLDLEFRLKAETFCRHYGDAILMMQNETEIRAELGSASGRAFLLCAAALRD